MPTPTDYLKKGALRTIEPAISLLARHNVNPNAITTVGTLLTIAAGVVYGTGHINGIRFFYRRRYPDLIVRSYRHRIYDAGNGVIIICDLCSHSYAGRSYGKR